MVLVHHHGDVGVGLDSRQDQVTQEVFTGVGASTAGSLQDDGAIGLVGSLHDRLDLLQVVHVESRDAITVFSGMVEQQTKRNKRHGVPRMG